MQLKRDESNISMISDIVKKKRITFLKSASLFADEDLIFGSPAKKEDSKQDNFSKDHENVSKHRKIIRKHLDDKKKLETAIERLQIGGDKKILDTISKEIQFQREKGVISKLLISK